MRFTPPGALPDREGAASIGGELLSSLAGGLWGPLPRRRFGERIGRVPGRGALVDSGVYISGETDIKGQVGCTRMAKRHVRSTVPSLGVTPKSSKGSASGELAPAHLPVLDILYDLRLSVPQAALSALLFDSLSFCLSFLWIAASSTRASGSGKYPPLAGMLVEY